MVTLTTIIGAALLWVLSMIGVHQLGKSQGKDIQKEKDDKKQAQQETEKLINEIQAKRASNEITQQINTEIDSAKSGDSLEWLRKNANRDGNDK